MLSEPKLRTLRPYGFDIRVALEAKDGTKLDAWTTVSSVDPNVAYSGKLAVLSGPHRGKVLDVPIDEVSAALRKGT